MTVNNDDIIHLFKFYALAARISDKRDAKNAAVKEQDFELAITLRDEERALVAQLEPTRKRVEELGEQYLQA